MAPAVALLGEDGVVAPAVAVLGEDGVVIPSFVLWFLAQLGGLYSIFPNHL